MKTWLFAVLFAFTCCRQTPAQSFDRKAVFVAQVRNVLVENDIGSCSGIILQTNLVLTAKHCDNAPNLKVDGEKAKVIKTCADCDLILLSVNTFTLPPIIYGDAPQTGDAVFAVGNVTDLRNVFTSGVVSLLDKVHIFTRGTLNVPGMSGSGLYDTAGRLIGVNNQYRVAPFVVTNGPTVDVFPTPILASAVNTATMKAFLGVK